MTKDHKTIITISRQMASGGAYIGHLVAKKLGCKYIEREVLHAAALDLGVDIRDLSGQDEKKTGFLESMMKSFAYGAPEAVYLPSRRLVYDEDLFEAECHVILQIADSYDAVIVGHAGFSVLRGRPSVFNVYIHAPKEFRVARLRKFHTLSAEQALAEIDDSDRQREKYLKTRTERDWHDARNYHLCLDSQATGFETAANTIIALAENMRSRT